METTTRPLRLSELPTPSFVINRRAFERNCRSVGREARRIGANVRPHVKTHKTAEGALIQWRAAEEAAAAEAEINGGGGGGGGGIGIGGGGVGGGRVVGYVASTVGEVRLLAGESSRHERDLGRSTPFHDILYGVPIAEARLRYLQEIRSSHPNVTVHLLIDDGGQVEFVEKFVADANVADGTRTAVGIEPFPAFLKVDTGYHRAGVSCRGRKGIALADRIIQSSAVTLSGIYSHCGHSYDVNDGAEMEALAHSDAARMKEFLSALMEENILPPSHPPIAVSVGSTPTAFSLRDANHDNRGGPGSVIVPNMEIHPGNYTLFDRQQLWTGACSTTTDVACRVLARVVGHYDDDERNAVMVDAGATALTRDGAPQGGWAQVEGHPEELECYRMSQEVTMIRPTDSSTRRFPFEEFALGSMVRLLPNHSCLAAACFDRYYMIDDEEGTFSLDQEIVEEWIPAKGWQ